MDTKSLSIEIIQPDAFWSVVSYLNSPSSLMNDRGGFFATVDDMVLDAKIGSHLRMRKDIVSSFPYNIDQKNAPDNVYEFVKENLKEFLNWENDIKEFLSAIEYGFSFSEVLWKQSNGYWVPDSLRNKKSSTIQFKLDVENVQGGARSRWVPVLTNGNKPLVEPRKFLVYRNNPKAENPYGTSDLLMCYWPWKFKQLGWEFWMAAARKAGVPSLAALFESPDPVKAKESAEIISDTLEQVENGSGVALSNVKELKVLEMGGVLADHKVLIDTCNQEISFALTTQSLSTQEGQFGTRAQATVHDANLLRVCHGDAKALNGTLQQLIDWMVELNYGPDVPAPKGEFDLESYASFEEVIKAVTAKIPVSKEKLYSRYGLPEPKDAEDSFITPETSSVTENTNPSVDAANVQATALNGAQVTALVELAAQVSTKILPIESAKAIAKASFPLVLPSVIDSMFDSLALSDDSGKKKVRSRIQFG